MTDPAREASRTLISRYASKLRFPQLFMVTATLFVIDLVVPDLVPFADEILLGLLTLLLANWKKDLAPADDSGEKPPMKDVTPHD
jgi:hypothetical protein